MWHILGRGAFLPPPPPTHSWAAQKKFILNRVNELKSGIKDGSEVTFKISSNVVRELNNENFPNKLVLTNTQFSKFHKAFANASPVNIKLSKAQLHKIGQSEGFLGKLLGPLL